MTKFWLKQFVKFFLRHGVCVYIYIYIYIYIILYMYIYIHMPIILCWPLDGNSLSIYDIRGEAAMGSEPWGVISPYGRHCTWEIRRQQCNTGGRGRQLGKQFNLRETSCCSLHERQDKVHVAVKTVISRAGWTCVDHTNRRNVNFTSCWNITKGSSLCKTYGLQESLSLAWGNLAFKRQEGAGN